MEPVVQLLVAVLGGIVVYIVYDWWTRRIHVKRIKSSRDSDLAEMCDLHDASFPRDEVKDSCDDIIRWLEEMERERGTRKRKLEEYLLVAKLGIHVVGYVYAQYYFESKYFFISYFAVNKQNTVATKKAAVAMIGKLVDLARANHPEFRGLVAELEEVEASKQMRRFRILADSAGFEAYKACIAYAQPRLLPAKELLPIPQVLLFFPGDERVRLQSITKAEALAIIRFIYLDVYGDSYMDDPELDEKYRSYLSELYQNYEDTLPDQVPLTSLRSLRRVSA